jgi:hypothetical protein
MVGESSKGKETEGTTSTRTFYSHGDAERFARALKEDLAEMLFSWDAAVRADEEARQEKREVREIKRHEGTLAALENLTRTTQDFNREILATISNLNQTMVAFQQSYGAGTSPSPSSGPSSAPDPTPLPRRTPTPLD